jgi:hypothetical protein
VLVIASAGEFIDLVADFIDFHALAAVESVGRIAPGAAQIAASQSHKYARQTGTSPFTLNRLENLGDEDGGRFNRSSISGDERSLHFCVPSTTQRQRTMPSRLVNARIPERVPPREKPGCIRQLPEQPEP